MKILLNNPYPLLALAAALLNLIILGVLSRQFYIYQKKQKDLTSGEGGADLAEIVLRQKKLLASHNKNLRELGQLLGELVENNKLNIQKIGVVRFNPFADTGSNMSFVVALLDARQNGILISSLHSREGTRIYAKPVTNGQSSHRLTDEEKQAITEASVAKPKS